VAEALAEALALGWANLALAAAGVAAGTALQRLAGLGLGLLAAPVMAFAAPDYLPAVLLILGALVGLGSTTLARDAVAWRELPPGMAGRVLGAGAAALVAGAVVGSPALPVVVALIVLAAVALSVAGLQVPVRRATLFAAGLAAGLMGTLTAIGGPPMALLYQHAPPRRAAAMQNAFFLFGMIVSLAALALAGLVGARHLALALILAPAALLGLGIAQQAAPFVERGSIRPWALGLAVLAALALLIRQVV